MRPCMNKATSSFISPVPVSIRSVLRSSPVLGAIDVRRSKLEREPFALGILRPKPKAVFTGVGYGSHLFRRSPVLHPPALQEGSAGFWHNQFVRGFSLSRPSGAFRQRRSVSDGDTHVRLVVSASLGMGADETEMKHEIRQLAERLLRPLKASDPTVTKPSSPQTGVV